jgi:uncharacterized iron-regulated protein
VIDRITLSCLIAFLLSGCAGMKSMPEPVVARIPGVTEPFHRNQIVDLASGGVVSFDRLMEQALTRDFIFFGENHDDTAHHLIEIQILQGLFARNPSLTMAMEFFQQDQQGILDRYTLGNLTEEEFLEEINWKKTWGFPYYFYRPLLLAAKQHGTRILALNAPREIVKKVAREGLNALDEKERSQIPRDMDLSNKSHRAYVLEAYENHEQSDLKRFEFFYQAQVVWEETMARNIAEFSKTHHQKVIVFSGNGHIVRKFGIPDRVQRRIPVSLVTIMPFSLFRTVTLERDRADYLWLTGQ